MYCFHTCIITGSKHKSYSCITTSMLSISNLPVDYLAMSKLPLLCTNLMSPFSKYSFITCLILQVKILHILFLKNILRTLDTPQTDKELKVKMKKINLKHNIHLYFLKIKKFHNVYTNSCSFLAYHKSH